MQCGKAKEINWLREVPPRDPRDPPLTNKPPESEQGEAWGERNKQWEVSGRTGITPPKNPANPAEILAGSVIPLAGHGRGITRRQLAFAFVTRSVRGARHASFTAPADRTDPAPASDLAPASKYPTRVLALIEGSRERLSTPAPARDFYTAPIFRLALRLADLRQHDVVLLSTRYGLTFLGEQLEPYESTSRDFEEWEIDRWTRQAAEYLSEEVYHPDQPLEVRLFVEPWTAAALIRHLAEIRPAWRVSYPFEGLHPKSRWSCLRGEVERATEEGPLRPWPGLVPAE